MRFEWTGIQGLTRDSLIGGTPTKKGDLQSNSVSPKRGVVVTAHAI